VFYLENVSDIADLHHIVADFFSMIFGGPNNYKGRSMIEAHKNMSIFQKDFDKVWDHMEVSFKKNGVKPDVLR